MDASELDAIEIRAGGRMLTDNWALLARYCGIGPPEHQETWAFAYYDSVPSRDPDDVSPTDVLAAGSIHPGLTRPELAWFREHRRDLARWLDDVPDDIALAAAEPAVVRQVADIGRWGGPVAVPLLSKVLHRKRPRLIPPVDSHSLRWFAPVIGEDDWRRSWRRLLGALRDDIDITNYVLLNTLGAAVAVETFARPAALRVLDILLWMRQPTAFGVV